MTTRKLQWGILSTAHINLAFLTGLRTSIRNNPLAIASREMRRAQSFAIAWGLPRAYGTYESLLEDPDIDVVYIPLPNGMHAEWAIKAAQAGKHVLCEKPLAMSTAEVDAMSEAAAKAGVVLLEALMYRHHPQTLKIKEILDSGTIGEMIVIRGSFTIDLTGDPENIRLNPQLGGGSIWDLGSYPISYARFLVGRGPIEVYAKQVIGSTGVDEGIVAQMQFEGDIFAQISCGFRSPFRMRMEVIGSKGAIEIPHPFIPDKNAGITLVLKDETRVIPIQGQDLYIGEIEDITDVILEGHSPRVSLAESRVNIMTIAALLNSAREGCPVQITSYESAHILKTDKSL
jgi:xylose dehydrogenase (NAD/NADP)